MSPLLPSALAKLASLPAQNFLYAIFLSLFTLSVVLSWYRHKATHHLEQATPTSAIRPTLLLSIIAFILTTGHWIVSWTRLPEDDIQWGIETARQLAFSEVLKGIFTVPAVIFADIALVYRLWVIWGYPNQYIIIIIPCLALAGLVVTGTYLVVALALFKPGDATYLRNLESWVLGDFVLTVSVSVYCTGMISWRIWSVRKMSREFTSGSTLLRALTTVIESAAIWTAWVIAAFILMLLKVPVINVYFDSCSSVAGISLTLINVRAGLRWAMIQQSMVKDSTRQGQLEAIGELQFAQSQHSQPDGGQARHTINV